MTPNTSPGRWNWLEKLGLHRPELRAWAMYDWANSSFATTMMVAVLPIYYVEVAAKSLASAPERTAQWGYTQSIALVIVVLLSPILGAMADYLGRRKQMLAVFVGLGVIGSCGLFFVTEGQYQLASALYIVGNVGFAGSMVFYESLLPHIASPTEMDRVSVAGYAIGYVGGGVLLVINLIMIQMPGLFGFVDAGIAVRTVFVTVGIWWALFSLPIFLKVPEPLRTIASDEGIGINPFTIGFKRLSKTFRQIREYDQLVLFLLAFWFYSDGIGTIIKMATVYGSEIGLDQSAMIGAIVLVQFLGIPCTFLYGPIADRIGVRGGIIFTLVIYTVICILGYFMETSLHFWMLACALAFVQGGAQALSRSYYASMVPPSMSSEFFAFYSVSSKFAGIFGPLIFGLVAQMFSGSRFAILFLVAFFIIGIIVILRVDHIKGRTFALAKELEFAKVRGG